VKKNYTFYKICRNLLFPIIKILYQPTIINKEYVPKSGSAIIAGNHKHALDPILVDLCTKRVVFTLVFLGINLNIIYFSIFRISLFPKTIINKIIV